MRRAALVVSLIVAAFLGALGLAGPAHSVEDPMSVPFGEFASPATASAGAPMWVKSITPCPEVPDGWWGYVAVSVLDQERPGATETLTSVDADLLPDGSWRATISAPSSAPAGPTASYFVAARCIIANAYPDPNAPDDRTSIPSQAYYVRPLLITSTGHGTYSGSGPTEIPGTATTTTTTSTTTTSTTSTTSTTVAAAGMNTAGMNTAGMNTAGISRSYFNSPVDSSYQPRLDGDQQDYSLDAVPASGSRTNDDGGGSNLSGFVVFLALLAGLGAGGWQMSRFTKR